MIEIDTYNLDLTELDTYMKNGQSILGKNILTWCNLYRNDTTDIDKYYAANEMYNNYFKNKWTPNLNNYYYIINCSILYKGRMYSIERDFIISPKYDKTKPPIKFRDINRLKKSTFLILQEINSNNNRIQDDIDKIEETIELLKYRLHLFNINTEEDIKTVFYKSSNYKRYQLFSIFKDMNNCMKTIKYNLW